MSDRQKTEASSRDEILRRVRVALVDVPADETPDDVPVPRDYRRSHVTGDVVALFAERVADYRATVVRARVRATWRPRSRVPARGSTRWSRPDSRPSGWPAWRRGSDDPSEAATDLDRAGAAITTAAVGIALTGTIVLDTGPGQGRRALTLVPDMHVCVIREDQIAGDVPEALERLDPRRPLTFISGPSATSDIELNRVEGVHGPRTLHVIIVGGVG